MGFNFPNSPTSGTTYTPAGGPTYTWDGTAWKAVIQGVPVTVYVSDTPPASPAIGQLWWDSDSGTMAIWYADADSGQWVQVSGAVSATPTAETRNRVVNPAMQIAQEQTSTTVSGGYLADQWEIGFAGSGTVTASQSFSVPSSMAKLLVGTADTSIAATDYLQIFQRIEGNRLKDLEFGFSTAKPLVLRFKAVAINAAAAGTYCVSLRNGVPDLSFVAPFTLTTSWQVFTIKIPPCITGTWAVDNTRGAYLTFGFAAGTNYHAPTASTWVSGSYFGLAGMTNGWGTAANDFRITDVGLYLDPLATGIAPPWVMPDEAEELRACQRYYWKTGARLQAYSAAADNIMYTIQYPVSMRVQAALTFPGVAYTNASGIGATAPTGVTGVTIFATATALGQANFNAATVHVNARM